MTNFECRLVTDVITEIKKKRNEIYILWKSLDVIRNKYKNKDDSSPEFDSLVGKLQYENTL